MTPTQIFRKHLPKMLLPAVWILVACGSFAPATPPLSEVEILATADAIQTRQARTTNMNRSLAIFTSVPTPRHDNGEVDIVAEMEADPDQWKTDNWPEYADDATFTAAQAQWRKWEEKLRTTHDEMPEWCTWVVTNSRLRAGPGTHYPIVGRAPTGTCLRLRGMNRERTWFQTHDGQNWIFYQLVQHVPTELDFVDEPMLIESLPVPTSVPVSQGCPGGCTTYPSWCVPPIKGNVSFNSGERIYHIPGDEFYDETVINPDYGERYFCTPEEAEAAGFRRAYN